MEIEIRTATADDAAPACDVLRRSISECCAEDHGNDAVRLAAWLGNKTPQVVQGWFESPAHHALVAIVEKRMAGVGMISRAGKIVLCHVAPEARFTGAGKALLRALESRAGDWGLRSVHVISTLTASDFYSRNGYVFDKRTSAPFGGDGLAFSKKLSVASYPKKTRCGCGG